MIKRKHYLYLGYYMNLKMFYCVENKNTYAADTYQKPSVLTLPLLTFFAVMLYVIGRNLRLDEITFPVAPIIIFSIVFGTVMGAASVSYTHLTLPTKLEV